MTRSSDRRATLAAWSQALPAYTPWHDRHLLRRFGPLAAGICLDELRDPCRYRPVFFFHNLLSAWPVLSLGYGAPLLTRGVARSMATGQAIDDAVRDLQEQVPSVGAGTIGFADFVAHAADWSRGRFGPAPVYLPHVFSDMSLLAAGAADGAFFLQQLDEACERLRRDTRLNLAIIGSVDAWKPGCRRLQRP